MTEPDIIPAAQAGQKTDQLGLRLLDLDENLHRLNRASPVQQIALAEDLLHDARSCLWEIFNRIRDLEEQLNGRT